MVCFFNKYGGSNTNRAFISVPNPWQPWGGGNRDPVLWGFGPATCKGIPERTAAGDEAMVPPVAGSGRQQGMGSRGSHDLFLLPLPAADGGIVSAGPQSNGENHR